MINIGITISTKQCKNIWNNGIAQNIINLYLVLKNIPRDYNIFLVNYLEESEFIYDIDDLKIFKLNDVLNDLNIIFVLGTEITDEQYYTLKNNNCKIVHYNCGSSYILDMQSVLFGETETPKRIYRHIPDSVWLIPQNYETNKHYFETIYKKECVEIPFVWSNLFIENALKELNINGYYTPTTEPKRISIFEPNLDIVKYSMYPILITEKVYNEYPDLIKHLYVTNALKIMNNKLFINTMNYLDIIRNGITTFEDRYTTPYFLETYTDIVISHQMYNPLNYAYLDALYLNYPLIHNASMIKDGGYYYDGFDAEQGKEKLLYALTQHDLNMEEYNKRSRIVLDRYLPTNKESIDKYDRLIIELLNK